MLVELLIMINLLKAKQVWHVLLNLHHDALGAVLPVLHTGEVVSVPGCMMLDSVGMGKDVVSKHFDSSRLVEVIIVGSLGRRELLPLTLR